VLFLPIVALHIKINIKKSKLRLYRHLVRPVLLDACETRLTAKTGPIRKFFKRIYRYRKTKRQMNMKK